MRNWISVGAVALACSFAAGRADATSFVKTGSKTSPSQIQTGLGSLLSGLLNGGKAPVITIPVVKPPVVTIPPITIPVVTVPGKLGETIADLIKDAAGKGATGKDQLAELIDAVFDKAKDKDWGWDHGGHHPGDGHPGCNPGTGTPPETEPGTGLPPVTDPGTGLPPIDGGGEEPVGGAVPEPASWLTMILGFGLIGAIFRSRRGRPALA